MVTFRFPWNSTARTKATLDSYIERSKYSIRKAAYENRYYMEIGPCIELGPGNRITFGENMLSGDFSDSPRDLLGECSRDFYDFLKTTGIKFTVYPRTPSP